MPAVSRQGSLDIDDLGDVEVMQAQRAVAAMATYVHLRLAEPTQPSFRFSGDEYTQGQEDSFETSCLNIAKRPAPLRGDTLHDSLHKLQRLNGRLVLIQGIAMNGSPLRAVIRHNLDKRSAVMSTGHNVGRHVSRSYTHSHTSLSDGLAPRATLPSTFRSHYRLFLRAISAAVLAQPDATSRLRKLWRPVFDEAAKVIQQIEDEQTSTAKRELLVHCYTRWEQRADNTIPLLYSSAISRGLPHRITQNLHQMIRANQSIRDPTEPSKKPWRGQLPPDAPEYKPKPIKPLSSVQAQLKEHFCLAPHYLGELVGMAEGWGGVTLGRTQRRR
ncbi:hypothetical protein NUW54_g7152 [Trametes sanguinea]|uniref:Uncharacterized protein n=1 Tax=Trametes sanguinea TaxID=158606 RepID=A0ACC1PPB9_9APHY|nr:hypothetical protein NUW54_g7152 [Trametes sanguinea]